MTKVGIDKTGPEEGGERGRYRLFGVIGAGGMGSVHIGRLSSSADFARTVAIKRPLPELLRDADFRAYIRREARVASRVHHPNVVATLDVVEEGDELWVIMEYVHGPSLAALLALHRERDTPIPLGVGVAWISDALRGLEAVHTARDERGTPLGIIHRDVSPHNILCGLDGTARIADFGLARAEALTAISRTARFKGKLAYASPEQADLKPLTPASDVYSIGVVAWELLTGRRLYQGTTPTEVLAQLLAAAVPAPSSVNPKVPPALDAVVLAALARKPAERFASASAMLNALKNAGPVAPVESVAEWLKEFASEMMSPRDELLLAAERPTILSQRAAQLAHTDSSEKALNRTGSVPRGSDTDPASGAHPRSDLRDGASWLTSINRALKGRLVLSLLSIAVGASLALFAADTFLARSNDVDPTPEAPAPTVAGHPAQRSIETSSSALVAGPVPPDAVPAALKPESPVMPVAPAPSVKEERRRAAPVDLGTTPRAPVDRAECDPPYSIDADGIRHMRPGCQ